MANSTSLLHKKTLVVITGASRGIGKEIAVSLSKKVDPASAFVLSARNESLLKDTQELVKQNGINAETQVFEMKTLTDDKSVLDKFKELIKSIMERNGPFESAMIIHNAGTLGDNSKRASGFNNVAEIRDYYDVNLVSFILLNNAFLEMTKEIKSRVIVNITSLLAIQGIPSFAIYASGKAGREGFFKVLAAEEKEIRVLNYSPGPVITDMQKQVQTTAWDSSVREFSSNSEKGGKLVTCEQTVNKLIELLESNTFETGSHVDYYD